MIKGLFFDFNGVIIDDEPLQLKAYQEVLKQYSINLSEEQYYASMGMDDKAFLRAAFRRDNKELTADLLQSAMEAKSASHRAMIEQELPLFPGVVDFVKAAARRYRLALVSMARGVEIEYVLERAQLKSLFSVVISADGVNNHKPDPECFQLAFDRVNEILRQQRQLPFLPHECLVIEDSAQGVQAGRALGMRTLGVTNTISEAALRAAGAEVVTASLADWTVDAVELVYR